MRRAKRKREKTSQEKGGDGLFPGPVCMCVDKWPCVCVWFGLFDRVKKQGEAVKPIEEEAKEWCFFISFFLSFFRYIKCRSMCQNSCAVKNLCFFLF